MPDSVTPPTQRHSDEHIIDVAMDIADVLLSMGVPVADVVSTASEFCRAFATRMVHVDVTYLVLTFSQESSPTQDALTVVRTVRPRAVNFRVVQETLDITSRAIAGQLTLDEADEQLERMIHGAKRWPEWTQAVSAGLISAGVAFMFGVSPLTIALTFLMGALGERTLFSVARLGLPPFVAQAAAALLITLGGMGLALTAQTLGAQVRATPIVVGGIVMQVVGMTFVGAFQDALDEFYVTASARLLKVAMLTTGIVVGLVAGLKLATLLHLREAVSPDPLPMGAPAMTVIGAALIAAAYSWYCHSTVVSIAIAGVVGAVAWSIYLFLDTHGMQEITACGTASVFAGLLAASVARRSPIPALELQTAGIVTMVPGLRLWNGLMQLVSYPLWSAGFTRGATTLVNALGVGLAIAVGASLGVIIGRPLRQRVALARNDRSWRRLFRRPRLRPRTTARVQPPRTGWKGTPQ